jgi:hypothetical protein
MLDFECLIEQSIESNAQPELRGQARNTAANDRDLPGYQKLLGLSNPDTSKYRFNLSGYANCHDSLFNKSSHFGIMVQ